MSATPSLSTLAFLLGGCLLALAAVLFFLGAEGGAWPLLVWGIVAFCLAAVSLTLGIMGRWRGGSRLEVRREQRLWRSGPLGRHWLRSRKRLP